MNSLFPPSALTVDAKAPALSETVPCGHCGVQFAPRKASGGKPQRYCSAECRTASHSPEPQYAQHSESHVGDPEQAANPPVAETKTLTDDSCDSKASLAVPVSLSNDNDFDWSSDNEDVVLREQRALAVYWNTRGDLVIRQERDWSENDDSFLVISRNNVDAFLDRLCDVVGIPSVGRSKP
jgi:hypothetical protein